MVLISMCTSNVQNLAAMELQSPQRCCRWLSSGLQVPVVESTMERFAVAPVAQFPSRFYEHAGCQLRGSSLTSFSSRYVLKNGSQSKDLFGPLFRNAGGNIF